MNHVPARGFVRAQTVGGSERQDRPATKYSSSISFRSRPNNEQDGSSITSRSSPHLEATWRAGKSLRQETTYSGAAFFDFQPADKEEPRPLLAMLSEIAAYQSTICRSKQAKYGTIPQIRRIVLGGNVLRELGRNSLGDSRRDGKTSSHPLDTQDQASLGHGV